jgi:DNA-binding transcriptional ArsR family regulator
VPNQFPSLDQVFHALADPTRRGMVERLVRGPASVSELSGAAPRAMSLPAVLQHLQVLEASGLVRSEKAGRVRTCRIEPDALRTAEAWVTGQRTAWETRLDRLGDYLAGHGTAGQNTVGQNTVGQNTVSQNPDSQDPDNENTDSQKGS